MGYTVARFLIVHSWDAESISAAHGAATDMLPRLVGPIMVGVVNSAPGFVVWTSGSKFGWDVDKQHVKTIDALIERLRMLPRPPRWIRVDSGEDPDDFSASRGYDGDYDHRYEVTHAKPRGNQ